MGNDRRINTQKDLEGVLERALEMIDLKYTRDRVLKMISDAMESRRINGLQSRRIREILDIMHPAPVEKKVAVEREPVDPEILGAFRNWKNGKVYR